MNSDETKKDELKLKLAFSGGGFRATFYCLGAFRRLVELGLWKNVCRIDSVSGGSITAGAIMLGLKECKKEHSDNFKDVKDFDEKVTTPLKRLGQSGFREKITGRSLVLLLIAWVLLLLGLCVLFSPFFNNFLSLNKFIAGLLSFIFAFLIDSVLVAALFAIVSRSLYSISFQQCLAKGLFKNELMTSLPAYPEWSVNTTCLNTCKRFRFKQTEFGGYKIGDTKDKYDIPISFVVACSAAFPQVFAPLRLKLERNKRRFVSKYAYDADLKYGALEDVYLTDGGVYDNLGIENFLHAEGQFIAIDAGGYGSVAEKLSWPKMHLKIIDTALEQIVLLRRRLLFKQNIIQPSEKNPEKAKGVILILGAPVKEYVANDKQIYGKFGVLSDECTEQIPSYDFLFNNSEVDELIANLRTDLDTFHDVEIDLLMWAGAIRMDAIIKRYLKSYLVGDKFNETPQKPIYPEETLKNILKKGQKNGFPFGVWFWWRKRNV